MLNYKAANIAKAEREHNANFFKTLEGFGEGAPSLSDILFVLQAGGITEEEAGAMVDEKGMIVAIQTAVEGLKDAGFLANAAKEVESQSKATSSTSGDDKKA